MQMNDLLLSWKLFTLLIYSVHLIFLSTNLGIQIVNYSLTMNNVEINKGTQTCCRSLLVQLRRKMIYVDHLENIMKTCKRPPPNLRASGLHALNKKTSISLIKDVEKKALSVFINQKKTEIRKVRKNINQLPVEDYNHQLKIDPEKIKHFSTKLEKRLSHFQYQNDYKWKHYELLSKSSSCSKTLIKKAKTDKNKIKKNKYQLRQIAKKAKDAYASGSVINLTELEVPDSAVVVLSYGEGFIPVNNKVDKFELRKETTNSLNKVSNMAYDMENPRPAKDSDSTYSCKYPKKLPHKSFVTTKGVVKDSITNKVIEEVNSYADNYTPKNRHKQNLNKYEKEGLAWLKNKTDNHEIVICKADKGGALLILPPQQIKELLEEKLEDKTAYKCVGQKDPFDNEGELSKMYFSCWRLAASNGYISVNHLHSVIGITGNNNKSTSDVFKCGIPYVYASPKIHKFKELSDIKPGVKLPIRLITALNCGLTVRGDKFIMENYLHPLALDYCKDTVKDSINFLQLLNEIGTENISNAYTFNIDVVDLYNSISRTLVYQALNDAISLHRQEWTPDFIAWLFDAIGLSMDSCYAKYGENWYQLISGVTTGFTLAVDLANMAVYKAFDVTIYSNNSLPLERLFRFVDDGTGIWHGTKEAFIDWMVSLNQTLKSQYNLELTYELLNSSEYCVFLDIKYKFLDGNLITDVHHKPTDSHRFLHFASNHPRHVFHGIVYGQVVRYRRIISDNIVFKQRLFELKSYFLSCGYPHSLLDPIMENALSMMRNLNYREKSDEKPFMIPLPFKFSECNDDFNNYINKNVNQSFKESPLFSEINKPILKPVARKGQSIRSMLFNQKNVVLHSNNAGRTLGLTVR